jgi:chitinase
MRFTRMSSFTSLSQICASVTKDDWTVVQPKKDAMGPYAYKENQWVGYDDIDSVKLKVIQLFKYRTVQ